MKLSNILRWCLLYYFTRLSRSKKHFIDLQDEICKIVRIWVVVSLSGCICGTAGSLRAPPLIKATGTSRFNVVITCMFKGILTSKLRVFLSVVFFIHKRHLFITLTTPLTKYVEKQRTVYLSLVIVWTIHRSIVNNQNLTSYKL